MLKRHRYLRHPKWVEDGGEHSQLEQVYLVYLAMFGEKRKGILLGGDIFSFGAVVKK